MRESHGAQPRRRGNPAASRLVRLMSPELGHGAPPPCRRPAEPSAQGIHGQTSGLPHAVPSKHPSHRRQAAPALPAPQTGPQSASFVHETHVNSQAQNPAFPVVV